MRYSALALTLISVALSAAARKASSIQRDRSPRAERLILFNSLGIMLAIVIPTILATLAVAFWFRASNGRARYQPTSRIPDVSSCWSGRFRR